MSVTTAARTFAPEELRELVREILEAAGAPRPTAASVADSLVLASVRGVDSHGVMRVPEYVGYVRDGRIDPAADPLVSVEGPVVRVDGRRAFGQLAALEAALAAVERSRRHGVALAVVSGVKHVGRLGEYVELCAERGCVGIAFANGGPPGGSVTPYGGRGRALGTNPLAYAFPVAGRPPVVADFSTSMVAEGKVRLHRDSGSALPEGWLVDVDGRPTTDPGDLYAGGAILPAAGHKGYALGLLVEVLGGVLAGEGCASAGDDPGNGLVLVVIEAGAAFAEGAARAVRALAAVPPAEGFDRVRVPGDPDRETEARRALEGIPLSEHTWRALVDAAHELGIATVEDGRVPG